VTLWLGDLNGLAITVRDEGGCSRSNLRGRSTRGRGRFAARGRRTPTSGDHARAKKQQRCQADRACVQCQSPLPLGPQRLHLNATHAIKRYLTSRLGQASCNNRPLPRSGSVEMQKPLEAHVQKPHNRTVHLRVGI
jgi:hypothetical protein